LKKRIISILLAAALITGLSGCSSLFKKEYLSVSEYADDSGSDNNNVVSRITDYDELKNAFVLMINEHKSEGRLRFTDYAGSLQSDLALACDEVKAENALASFAVDYLSYDLSRIATYYEAVVYITYKRTQSEIDSLQYISGESGLPSVVEPVLEKMDSYISFRITSGTITAEGISQAVNKAYEINPASCVVPPVVTVQLHPESGLQHIVELEIEYGWKLSELQKMKTTLKERIQDYIGSASGDSETETAKSFYNQLANKCTYDPDGAIRSGRTELNGTLGSTAYGALVESLADSRGLASAFSALCYKADIECYVVSGTLDGTSHFWNIVRLGDSYYHVDVSAYDALGAEGSFMQSDSNMQGHYQWDTSAYPACGEQTNDATPTP